MNASAAPAVLPIHPYTFVSFDDGRLQVQREFCDLLMQHGLASFDALYNFAGGEPVRKVGARSTVRLDLESRGPKQSLYLKRYDRLPFREACRSMLRLRLPVWGAIGEWRSILKFVELGIPTLTPVALGSANGRSLLVTQSLDGWISLRDATESGEVPGLERALPTIARELAEYARQMHAAGLQHQDFYLDHVFIQVHAPEAGLRIIDLGRVRRSSRLSRREIIKDLAQLNFSARVISCRQRLKFLHYYLGRPLTAADRCLIGAIASKSHRIARHTRKHAL